MKVFQHKRGNFYFWIPARLSTTGKRRCVYKPTKTAAYNEVLRLKHLWREHGKAAISDEERHYIAIARQKLGDLSRLPQVLLFWERNGPDAVVKTTLSEAVKRFLDFRAT